MATFRRALIDHGLLADTPIAGVSGYGAGFAAVADAVSAALRRAMAGADEHLRFASVMPRADLERIGYFRNFPQLLGSVHCFCGDEGAHRALIRAQDAGESWADALPPSDVVLIPAACYTVYPRLARKGTVPEAGHIVQVEANCFRREPSPDPCRAQSFHMHELVRVGRADQALAFRDRWLEKGQALFRGWGLDADIIPADDPFFGRAAVVMAKAQRAQALKFELVLPVSDDARPTACASANYHLDNFGKALGLAFADGATAHSACVGFGIERTVLALFRHHGFTSARWPRTVREALRLD